MNKYEERYQAAVIADAKVVAELLGVTPVDIEYNYMSTVWMWLGPQHTDRVEVVGGDKFVVGDADVVAKHNLPGSWFPFSGNTQKLTL
ncbi:MAG: hypothetical protein M0R06_23985 [Sphaerochaeta sp.]|jgi:hypothetical protein|nr:hypothetical protein [Sphaerochaeta sp.]